MRKDSKLIYYTNNKNSTYFRLVNILQSDNCNKDCLWNIVKKTRKNFYLSNLELITNQCVDLMSDSIELPMNNSTDEIMEYATDEDTLKLAGEMFIYLTYCPPKILSFYYHLFKNSTTKTILLALNNILREPSSIIEQQSAEKVWSKVTKTLDLLHYEDILSLVNGTDNSAAHNVTGQYCKIVKLGSGTSQLKAHNQTT